MSVWSAGVLSLAVLVPGAGSAAPPATSSAAPTQQLAAPAAPAAPAQMPGRNRERAEVEKFTVVPWRDGRDRVRLAAVLIAKYPRASRTLPPTDRLTGRLSLDVGSPGNVLVRVRDVARVPVWRPGARPRVVHVLKFSARQSRQLQRHRSTRAWGAQPRPLAARITLTLATDERVAAATTGWLPFPNPIDWAKERWAKRDAECREPLPPEDRWTSEDRQAYLACAVIWIGTPLDQGVPEQLRKTYTGKFTMCSSRMQNSRKSWELDVDRWDARFTMYDTTLETNKRLVLATLDMTAKRDGRSDTYLLRGAGWQTDDSWLKDLLPLTMSVTNSAPPVVKFVKNCPYS